MFLSEALTSRYKKILKYFLAALRFYFLSQTGGIDIFVLLGVIFLEFAKSRAKHAYVPTCQRGLRASLRANVFACQLGLRTSVPAC